MHEKWTFDDRNILCFYKELIQYRRSAILSAKYRAAHQEKIDNLKDEERQEFNLKLEKTKELSRDTNRRRRALEERRKNYEAEEERKRREILAQRKKEIQEATEKFQRSNIVRHRRKTKHTERATPAKTVKHDNTQPVTPKVINGRPYYPSVEEVMALLRADHADVIDRLSNGDNNPHDQHESPCDVTETTDITREQHIIEQERLRNEVVGRIEPKLAFSEEVKEITAGVLPTTIRRNSPSGSLSSIDSLDAVPDEVLEMMPASDRTSGPRAGIIRKGKKGKRDSRVTFNENVAFSDGVVGTLKRKQVSESSASSPIMPKQKSFFELSNQPGSNTTLGEDIRNQCKPKIVGKDLESSKDSLIFNHYLSQQSCSKSNTSVASAQMYPHVNTSDIATTGVITYSVANNTTQSGGNSVPTVTVSTAEPKANALHVLPNSPRINGHSGYKTQTKMKSKTGSAAKNSGSEKDYTQDNILQGNSKDGVKMKPYLNGSDCDDARSYNDDEPKKKTNESSACSQPFSSINASMLKDSLEMRSDIKVSQNDHIIPLVSTQEPEQPRTTPHSPDYEAQRGLSSFGRITTHAEIPPETPLVPVTKRDFLSKALRSDNSGTSSTIGVNMNALSNHASNQAREELDGDWINESSASRYFNGNSEQELQSCAYRNSLYGQERDVSQNSRILSGQSESTMLSQSGNDRSRQSLYGNGPYNQRQIVANNGGLRDQARVHNGNYSSDGTKQNLNDDYSSKKHYNGVGIREFRDNTSYPTDHGSSTNTTKHTGVIHPIEHENSTPKQEYQHTYKDNHGKQRPNKTTGESTPTISSSSRAPPSTRNNAKLATIQSNRPGTAGTPNQPSYRPSLDNVQQNSASRKPSSEDELLRSVQENIERISMTPVQQRISRTNSSGMHLDSRAALYHSRTPESRHKRAYSDNGRRPAPSELATVSEFRGNIKSAANGRERKLTNRKIINQQRSKLGEAKNVNGNSKRFDKFDAEYDSGIDSQRRIISMEYDTVQSGNNGTSTAYPNTNKHLYTSSDRVNTAHPSQAQPSPTYKTDYQSLASQNTHRLYGVPPECRDVEPQSNWTIASEKKQRKNSSGLALLDKTPTDDEINTLWETVRTCLKHEQPQKAASDSVVNNVRYSRSESGPLVGNHYLIEGNACAAKQNGVSSASDNDSRYWSGSTGAHFRRQGSLDSLQRRGSADNVGYTPPRKGSLLQYRSHTSDRRLTPRNSPTGRPPVNPQYFHSLRGPMTSTRGPQKSNTVKTEEPRRPQLSYAEFQAVMQASADVKTRNTEGDRQKNSRQGIHQPIIKNCRREPSALSLEEKRLLESLDRLNERLKVQEAFAGKIGKSPSNGNIHMNKVSSSKFSQPSFGNNRFGRTRSDNGKTNTSSLLNRR